jgi:protein-disulfide isomerase
LYDEIVILRRTILPILCAAVCFAQADWKTATSLSGVDLSPLTAAQRTLALNLLRSESCPCGCTTKLAECRVVDPQCATSRKFADLVVKMVSEGKSPKDIHAELEKIATEPPPLLNDPVKISIDGDPMRGPANARVTIVEFSDFQCPYCAKAVPEVKQLLAKYPNDVRFVFKQYPLDIHSQAALAAEAALAAQAQGKFWELHDKMYANFRQISRPHIDAWAKELGLDMTRFQADLASHVYAKRVASEEKQGDQAGVEGTPTFYIDGARLNAVFNVATVSPLIDKKLKPRQ